MTMKDKIGQARDVLLDVVNEPQPPSGSEADKQTYLAGRLQEMRARSVEQTIKNLDQQLFDAVALKPGRIEITETTISYEV
ncbi:MAG TPA: hypothetical protein PLY87_01925 [Planctomycetaceae bacterium]|nr:hypothetical protein [Planctomycetaceae bacterium]